MEPPAVHDARRQQQGSGFQTGHPIGRRCSQRQDRQRPDDELHQRGHLRRHRLQPLRDQQRGGLEAHRAGGERDPGRAGAGLSLRGLREHHDAREGHAGPEQRAPSDRLAEQQPRHKDQDEALEVIDDRHRRDRRIAIGGEETDPARRHRCAAEHHQPERPVG